MTLHPDEAAPEVLFADNEQLARTAAGLLEAGALDWQQGRPDQHIWVSGSFEPHSPHAIALPVRQVIGHGRLVITVFFETDDEMARARAEAAYLSRRPFAVGYFRLWQQDRLYRRDTEILRTALDRVGLAIFLVTKAGELAFANITARRLLEQGNGLYEKRNRLHASTRSDHIALEGALNQVIDEGAAAPTPLLVIRRADAAALTLSILPPPVIPHEDGEIGALVFAVDPGMEIGDLAAAVCRAFRLSRVETDLACRLASGDTLQEAALRLRLKIETARTYLKAIFWKMGVNRQSDLVRIILVSLIRTSNRTEFQSVRGGTVGLEPGRPEGRP